MTAVPEQVSIDSNTALASVPSELQSISTLKEEQRTVRTFLDGKNVFTVLLNSLFYQVALRVIRFVDWIG